MDCLFIIFMFSSLLLLGRNYKAMVVTMFEDEKELFELFESTDDEVVSGQSDPLKGMDETEKIALWERILSSTYFVDKNMQNAVPTRHDIQEQVSQDEGVSVERTSQLESVPYSYMKRDIHYGDKKQTRITVLCQAESRDNGIKEEYHIFYAYRRDSYFIGLLDSSKNEIFLTGLAEPRAERKPYENQEKLEEDFRAQINDANLSGIRKTSPPSSPTKGLEWGIRKLRLYQKVRVCGQVFGATYYWDQGIRYVGTIANVKRFSGPLLVSFKSERFEKTEIYEYMFGCVVEESGKERVYLISNAYDFSDEQVAVYVLTHDDQNDKQFLDSYITAVTALMPTAQESVRRFLTNHH